jgi:hypothetical protein
MSAEEAEELESLVRHLLGHQRLINLAQEILQEVYTGRSLLNPAGIPDYGEETIDFATDALH